MVVGVIEFVKSVEIFSYSAVLYGSHKPSIEIIPAGRMALRLGVRLPFCPKGWSVNEIVVSQLDGSSGSWLSILAEVADGE